MERRDSASRESDVKHVNLYGCVLALAVVAFATTARAQGQIAVDEGVRRAHIVEVTPHQIVLTPGRRTATVTLTNAANTPVEADIELQYAYPYWQTSDTVLFTDDVLSKRRARDTAIADPGPSDRYAGRWISGLPDHVALAPHETRRITLTITPPASLADGEYIARLNTIVRTNRERPPKSKDTKATFRLPIAGNKLPDVRDSAEVFFRKGEMTSRLRIVRAVGEIDPLDRRTPRPDFGSRQLWLLAHVRPEGTAHFDGQLRAVARDEQGREYPYDPAYHFTMYREGIMRFWAKTQNLPRGRYVMVLTFEESPDGPQGAARVPVEPTSVELPFVVR